MRKETCTLRFNTKRQHVVKLEAPVLNLLEPLPWKETCDCLVSCYLRTFDPMYRIVHVPSFQKDFDQIWDSSPGLTAPVVFLVKLSLVLAMGTIFYDAGDDNEANHMRRLAQTWVQNTQWWLTGPSEKATYNIDGLQVFCLLLLARQTAFNCPGASSWLSAASLLRMAITVGLHRDPSISPSLSLYRRVTQAVIGHSIGAVCASVSRSWAAAKLLRQRLRHWLAIQLQRF